MTTVRLEYTFADSYLTKREVFCRVLLPTALGTSVILLMRYTFNAWPASDYNKVSLLKDFICFFVQCGVGYLIYRSLFAFRQKAKAHFLHTFLKNDSVLYRLLNGKTWSIVTSVVGSFLLTVVAYIVVQTYSGLTVAAIACASAAALFVSQIFGCLATDSLRENVSKLLLDRVRRGTMLLFVLLAVIVATIAEDGMSQQGELTTTMLEQKIKQEVRHPILYVQRATRIVTYFNLEIVRVRDREDFYPFGWIIYFFFLTPNAIPLYGVVGVFLGCDFCRRKSSHELHEKKEGE